jgi:post-segregation antitoxin (ccd killing protein)
MPKVSVYLPDELYDEVRRRGLPLSAVTQEAIERRIATDDRSQWISRMRTKVAGERRDIDTARVMDEVREDFGA